MARLSRPLRCAAAALIWAAALATPATVRVAVPDIAGMLYPQQTQRVERFGTAPYSSELFTASSYDGGALPACEDSVALCLEVVWTSEYAADPFVLTAFESKFSVSSKTFDDLTASASPSSPAASAGLRPVIEGDRAALWRFHSPTGPSIDLLFRLRQQSQVPAVRDQLLVHVAATSGNAASSTATVETFSVYGNQYVRSTVKRVSRNQIRLDVAIRRNASGPDDVVFSDAYPLVPVDTGSSAMWRITDERCMQCTALLYGCSNAQAVNLGGECTYEKTTARFVTCLRSDGLAASEFKDALDNKIVKELQNPLSRCFRTILEEEADKNITDVERQWWNATQALGCLAVNGCPFGPLDGVLSASSAETHMIQLSPLIENGVYLSWQDGQSFSGYIKLTFGEMLVTGGNPGAAIVKTLPEMNEATSVLAIESAFRAALPRFDEINVHVTKEYFDSGSEWFLQVKISNLVFPDLSIRWVSSSTTIPNWGNSGDGSTSLQAVPLNSSQLVSVTPCDDCMLELEPCREDDVCRQVVLPCVITTLETLKVTDAVVDPVFGSYQVSFFPAIEAMCLKDIPVLSWNPIRRGLACASQHRCALDENPTNNTDEFTYVGFTSGTQVINVPTQLVGDTWFVSLSVSHPPGSPPLQFDASIDKIASFLQVSVLKNAADVEVEALPDSDRIQITIVYKNSVFSSNPSFEGTPGLVNGTNTSPRIYFEVGDRTVFSLAMLLRLLRANLIADVKTLPPFKYSWDLAPQCSSCNAQLFGCSAEDVQRRTCTYDRATSPLAQCVREALPRTALADLLNTTQDDTSGEESLLVTTDLTRCVQRATAMAQDTTAARVSAISALSCYITTKCPFGPVDLVQNTTMIQLVASAYVQTLRVRAKNFQIQLLYSMGTQEIASFLIRSSSSPQLLEGLRGALNPVKVHVGQADMNCEGIECTITIRYTNVVVSDFVVRVGHESVPSPALIEHSVLRSTSRLVAMPRLESLVFFNETNSYEPTPAPSPSTSSINGPSTPAPLVPLVFSRQCELCDSIHLVACERSKFCQEVVKPCFNETLTSNTNGNVDLAAQLRTCAGEAFFDWWEPLQRWLVCYAMNQCPTAPRVSDRPGDSYLEFLPATITISDVWAQGTNNVLTIEAPMGSSLHGFSRAAASREELETHLNTMTQGLTKVSVTVSPSSESPGVIKITYYGPFLGELPRINASAATSISVSTSPASLVLKSTSTETPTLSAFTTKLTAGSTGTATYASCGECAANSHLEDTPRDVLECLLNSFEDASQTFNATDYDLWGMLNFCSLSSDASDLRLAYKFLRCLSDHQCPVNESPAVYLRFTYGAAHWKDLSGLAVKTVEITTPRSPPSPPYTFNGTLEDIRNESERVLGTNATVELVVRKDGNYMSSIDYIYHDYIGIPLRIRPEASSSLPPTNPQVVLYSNDTQQLNASLLIAAFANYTVQWSVNTMSCVPHLDGCVRSDSVDSLVCRHRFLPEVYATIGSPGAQPSMVSNTAKGIELGEFLRERLFNEAKAMEGALYLGRFLLCLANARTPLGRPSFLTPRVELSFTPGLQMIHIPSSEYTLEISLPQGIASSGPTPITLDANLGQHIVDSVLGIPDVDIQVSNKSASGDGALIDWTLVYGNYLGWLPSFNYTSMVSNPPSLVLTSADWNQQPWPRLKSILGNYSRVGVADQCSNCSEHLAGLDQALVLCVVQQLHQLSANTSAFSINECVMERPAETEWLPLARFFECMMTNGCDAKRGTKSDDEAAIYVGIQPGALYLSSFFQPGAEISTPVTLQYPTLPGMEVDPDPVDVTVSRAENYFSLIEAIDASLDKNGQLPIINVTESITLLADDNLIQLSLKITVSNFFGFLPSVGDNDPATPPRVVLANVFSQPDTTSPWRRMSSLIKRSVFGTSPPVLTGSCAQYAAEIYGCTTNQIASGACSYDTARSVFSSCLRGQLPRSWFTDTLLVDTQSSITDQLKSCFNEVITYDEPSPPASFQDDLWYKVSSALALFEQQLCPFGPLEVAYTELQTVRLESQPRIFIVTIPGDSFRAKFRVKVKFRERESEWFDHDTSESILTTLLSAILPANAAPRVEVARPSSSVQITITVGFLYLDSSLITLQVEEESAGMIDAWDGDQTTKLNVTQLNATFLLFGANDGTATLEPTPAPAPTPTPTNPTPTEPTPTPADSPG